MAVVVESTTQTLVGANDATPTFNMPATRPDGDLYILFGSADGDASALAFTDWTALPSADAEEGTVGCKVLYRVGASEPASYTGTGDSEEYVFHVVRISGFDAGDPFGPPAVGTGNSTAAAVATGTADVDNTFVLWGYAVDTDDAAWASNPAGGTRLGSASSSGGGAGSVYGAVVSRTALLSAGTSSSGITMGGTYDDNWAVVAVLVQPGGAAPAGQPFRKRFGGVPGMRLGGTTFGGSFHG